MPAQAGIDASFRSQIDGGVDFRLRGDDVGVCGNRSQRASFAEDCDFG
jgi:hypothetical protein